MFDSFASTSRLDFIGDWYDRVSGRDKWTETDATVVYSVWVENDEGGGDSGFYRNTYYYMVAERYYEGRFTSATRCASGDIIAVRYNPNNPKRKYAYSYESGRKPLIVGVCALIFLTLFLIAHLL